MALCGYSSFIDGARGTSTESPANFECVMIRQCTKDILGHLAFCKVMLEWIVNQNCSWLAPVRFEL